MSIMLKATGIVKRLMLLLVYPILLSALILEQQRQVLPNIKAAVIVPGFLTGASDFQSLAQALTDRGIPTVAVPMPNWHWLPCLGGRSMRPVLERLDFVVRHVASGNINNIPSMDYNMAHLWHDFEHNPGGILKVGGSWEVEDYPVVEPAGTFPAPANPPIGKIALIGHSAGGWISRIYLSERNYGGRAYAGSALVHSLVTLGTPHATAPGPAFAGIRWCNDEPSGIPDTNQVRRLAVGGTGFAGGEWGALTQSSYAFCCTDGTDGTTYNGDGVTPIQSALAWPGAEHLVVPETTHFCWSDVFGGGLVAPELTRDHAAGRIWYGSDNVVDLWAKWLQDV
jgi:pimeloyl-ACP methyl ester carboxylesterase